MSEGNLGEILFFGMCVKAGQDRAYRIENEEGQMEICHLTNCALVSNSTTKKPIYVRMKDPDTATPFVIGALVPGHVYSFSTDLIVNPDTSFSHSGGPDDEVHLTGYRAVNSEGMFMGRDLEATSSDEAEEDLEADEEDEDFIVDDDKMDEGVEADSDEEDEEEDDDEDDRDGSGSDEEEGGKREKDVRGKVSIKEEREFPKLMKERSKAREKLLKLCEQGNEFAGHPDAIDMDIQALEGGNHFLHGDPSDEDDEDDDDENMSPPEDDEIDDDDEVQRHMAELAAEDGSESGDDDEGSEDESDSEEEGDAENAGLLQQFKKVTPAAKKSRAAHDALRSRRISVEEEQDVDDEDDEDADPSTRAKAVTLARQQKDKIEREKRKQKLNGASAGAKGGAPAAKEEGGQKRKASAQPDGQENNASPVKKVAKGLAHPQGCNEATREYAEALYEALVELGEPVRMSKLAQKITKPKGSEKMGKVIGKYKCFHRAEGKDLVSLAD